MRRRSPRLSPRSRAIGSLVAGATLALQAVPASAAPAPLFSDSGPWNTALPRSVSPDSSSDRRVSALADLVARRQRTEGSAAVAASSYSTPIYRVGVNTPRVPVSLSTGAWGASLASALAAGVPIPDGASPAAGTDGHLTVYQASTDTLWELWRAKRTASGWQASWGGVIQNASTNPGYYSGSVWPGLRGASGWNWGSTGTSLPVAAGTITQDEMRRGEIDHALAMAVPDACKDRFVWPAQRTDGTSSSASCIPEGARLRLDPSVDVSSLGLSRPAEIIARAAQRYGMIVRDRTRVSVSFYAESPDPGRPNPYAGADGLFAGLPSWKILNGFPWKDLQVMPLRWCSRAPCEADASASRAKRVHDARRRVSVP